VIGADRGERGFGALFLELPDGSGRVAPRDPAGKSPDGASCNLDEATNLVRLLSFLPYSPCSSAYGQASLDWL
jgi:hypothetical protein